MKQFSENGITISFHMFNLRNRDDDFPSLRHARREDFPAILEIRIKAFSHFAPASYSPKEVRTLLNDIDLAELLEMIRKRSLFVAVEGQNIVGCGGWLNDSVRHLYVLPEMAKRRIGSNLLQVLETDYKKRAGKPTIKAGVTLYSRLFYEKNGFVYLETATDWDGSKFCRMQKNI